MCRKTLLSTQNMYLLGHIRVSCSVHASILLLTTMGFHHISRDLKLAAIRLYENDILELNDILYSLGFSQRTFYYILRLWRDIGNVVKPQRVGVRGRLCNLDFNDLQYVLGQIAQSSEDKLIYLGALYYYPLWTSVCRSINETAHKDCTRARQRTQGCFIERVAQYTPEQLGFLAEVSKDEWTPSCHDGRLKKGLCVHKQHPFVRGCHTSMEALQTLDGIISGTVVEGSMTKEMFIEYLEYNVVSLSCWACGILWPHFICYWSCPGVWVFWDHWVYWWWTMQRCTMGMKFWSLFNALVCDRIDLWPLSLHFDRCHHWVSSTLFSRSQPYWRGVLKNQTFHSSSLRILQLRWRKCHFFDMWEVLEG